MSKPNKRALAAERRANVQQRTTDADESARIAAVKTVPAPDVPTLRGNVNGARGLMFTDAGWNFANALFRAGATAEEAANTFGCNDTGHFFGLVLRYESDRNWRLDGEANVAINRQAIDPALQ